MAKKKEDEIIVDVEQAYSKVENYIEDNQKSLTIIAFAVVAIIGGYFAWQNLIVAPQETEARDEMWKAEQYFEVDSLNLALNGDGNHLGFLDIIGEYGVTKTGNLARYYAGICYLRQGQYNQAIEHLDEFESSDVIMGSIARGATGDAYMQLGNKEQALSYYMKAANHSENDYSAPIYLMKAAAVCESLNDYSKAKSLYEELKKKYPKSPEGLQADKYIARANAYTGS